MQAEEIALSVGYLVMVRQLEHGEFLVLGQAWKPLGIVRSRLVVVFDIEEVSIAAPASYSWVFRPQVLHVCWFADFAVKANAKVSTPHFIIGWCPP
jgi:hypothetical protein